MRNKTSILVQSYEEIKYLINLIESEKDKIYKILVYGNVDLYKHIKNLFENRKILVTLIKPFNNLILFYSLKYLSLFKKFKNLEEVLDDSKKLIFFTRICVPHMINFISFCNLKKIKCKYIFLPLQKTYKEKENGEIFEFQKFKIKSFNDLIYTIYYKIFFSGVYDLQQVSTGRVTVLERRILEKYCKYEYYYFKKKDNDKYLEKYIYNNYHFLKNAKNPYIIFYDQSYHLINIVDQEKYINTVVQIFERLNKLNFKIYYKMHPGRNKKRYKFIPRYVEMLESYIPSEFTTTRKSIPLAITSGAIFNKPRDIISFSMIEFMPYIKKSYYNSCKNTILSKGNFNVLLPRSKDEFVQKIKERYLDIQKQSL